MIYYRHYMRFNNMLYAVHVLKYIQYPCHTHTHTLYKSTDMQGVGMTHIKSCFVDRWAWVGRDQSHPISAQNAWREEAVHISTLQREEPWQGLYQSLPRRLEIQVKIHTGFTQVITTHEIQLYQSLPWRLEIQVKIHTGKDTYRLYTGNYYTRDRAISKSTLEAWATG